MLSYPVSVPGVRYRGADPKKRAKNTNINRIASKIEAFLNADLAKRPSDSITVYISYTVAREIGEDGEIVRNLIFGMDCGSNGVTILKGDGEHGVNMLRRAAPLPSSFWSSASVASVLLE
jgi:uncharacterized protein YfaP (DUF2135 family)